MVDALIRYSLPILRISLGVVYIWFGALKIANATPVGDLVAHTVPFIPAHFFVPALGVFECILGVALLVGRQMAIIAALMIAHLCGTMLVLVTQPLVAFRNGNPIVLTMTGEFVVKNVVLISAGLVLAAAYLTRGPTHVITVTHDPESA
ncbi:MAG: DoxX family membrane protein [Micromonosporaceae bacterium]|nr:DoxX family membrane protein [Micromonosporaceae bacterium]